MTFYDSLILLAVMMIAEMFYLLLRKEERE